MCQFACALQIFYSNLLDFYPIKMYNEFIMRKLYQNNIEVQMITYEQIKKDETIRTYVKEADASLAALGFTEHSFAHVTRVAETAGEILATLGYDERTCELARIAGFLHDIGNLVNRVDHSQSGAIIAFRILDNMGMAPEEICPIVAAIGNHDEGTGVAVNPVSAALILADKTDVRRTRVRNTDSTTFDIHDKVNFSVENATLNINTDKKIITLELTIVTEISSIMNYFEIFLGRMLLCQKAAEVLSLTFSLVINSQRFL